ncbi:MAG: hypothetical protein H0W41_06865, partial [Chloroflexi bacterium]|nr:hypothetical protein [Chloroflexota bacterium]
MNDESDRLRAENDRLTAELAKRDGELAKQNEAIAKLQHYLRRLLRGRFGRATEKLIGIPATDQSLIAEIEAFLAEDRAAQSAPPPATPAAPAANDSSPAGPASTPSLAADQTASVAAKRGSRQRPSATFPNLEVRDSVIDVPAAQRLDSSGAAMIRCGDQVVETVVFTKPEVFIERVTYARYRSVGDLDGDGRAA